MCLFSNGERLKAAEDIVCYKVVCKSKYIKRSSRLYNMVDYLPLGFFRQIFGKYTYATPFVDMYIDKKIIEGEIDLCAEGEECVYKCGYDNCNFEIDCGFIHTFKDEYGAINYLKHKNESYHYKYEVFKCIIPEGTDYFKGKINDEEDEGYASKKIRFIEKIYSY